MKKLGIPALLVAIIIIAVIIIASHPVTHEQTSSLPSVATQNIIDESLKIETARQKYEILQNGEWYEPFEIPEKALAFLDEHDDLFPAKSNISPSLIDEELDYRKYLKNRERYGDKLMKIDSATVVQINEFEITEDNDYLSIVNVIAGKQQYYVLYIGTLDDVFDEDKVDVIGLPIGTTYFENTMGGQTIVIVIAGSRVEKISDEESSMDNGDSVNAEYQDDTAASETQSSGQIYSENFNQLMNMGIDHFYIDDETIAGLSPQELTYLRNSVYARHGYIFQSQELNEFYSQYSWYIPDPSATVDDASATEQMNADYIRYYQEEFGLEYTPK